jgi:hypothetical protein
MGTFLQEINAPVGLTFSVSPSVLSCEVSRVTGHLTTVLENWRLPKVIDISKILIYLSSDNLSTIRASNYYL